MIQITELPGDIFNIINELLYSYDNNLRFVNKSFSNNDEFIKSHNKIINNRLLRIKKKYSCIKIQLFIKNYICYPYLYIPPLNYNFNTQYYIHSFGRPIRLNIPVYFYSLYQSPMIQIEYPFERIIKNKNSKINKSSKYIKKKRKKIKYNKKINNKKINNKRKNYKSHKNSFRKK